MNWKCSAVRCAGADAVTRCAVHGVRCPRCAVSPVCGVPGAGHGARCPRCGAERGAPGAVQSAVPPVRCRARCPRCAVTRRAVHGARWCSRCPGGAVHGARWCSRCAVTPVRGAELAASRCREAMANTANVTRFVTRAVAGGGAGRRWLVVGRWWWRRWSSVVVGGCRGSGRGAGRARVRATSGRAQAARPSMAAPQPSDEGWGAAVEVGRSGASDDRVGERVLSQRLRERVLLFGDLLGGPAIR